MKELVTMAWKEKVLQGRPRIKKDGGEGSGHVLVRDMSEVTAVRTRVGYR